MAYRLDFQAIADLLLLECVLAMGGWPDTLLNRAWLAARIKLIAQRCPV